MANARGTKFPIPKNEQYRWSEAEQAFIPVLDEDGLLGIKVLNSDIMQPVDLQSSYQTTFQTHAGVVVPPATDATTFGVAISTVWIDTNGFTEISFTQKSNATGTGANGRIQFIWSNDGVNNDSYELQTASVGNNQYRSGSVPTKARYVKVQFDNMNTGAPQTVTSWVYLKV